jgi:hypothetical protein
MMTTYERGMLAGQRELVLLFLADKFGALPPEVRKQVETSSSRELEQIVHAAWTGQPLQERGLTEADQ